MDVTLLNWEQLEELSNSDPFWWQDALGEMLRRNAETESNLKVRLPSPGPTKPKISPVIRALIWDKTNGKCWYCDKQTNPWRDYCIDHVEPISKGGSHDLDNLVPSCRSCNAIKGNRDVFYLMEKIRCAQS